MGSENFKQMTVVSGKGGTGKTTVIGSFAALAKNIVLADCDVDASNLYLLLDPAVKESNDFFGAKVAVRDNSKCIHCNLAEIRCRFDAIKENEIDQKACEGCGFCVLVCPTGALSLQIVKNGEYYVSETRYGPMVHAKLNPGGESSGRLVTVVRQKAEDIAIKQKKEMILIDGPPGIGCTVTAALTDVDIALIVTEPTISGIHDMKRIVELIKHFGLFSVVIINKFDINVDNSSNIKNFCEMNGIPVLAEIPYDETVMHAVSLGKPLVECSNGPAAVSIRQAWDNIIKLFS